VCRSTPTVSVPYLRRGRLSSVRCSITECALQPTSAVHVYVSLHDEALAVVLRIDKKEVVNGLFRVCAYGAVGGVASLHTMEVKVESNRKFGILSIQFLTFPTEFRARPAPAGVVSVATVCTSEGSVCIAFCRPVGFRASLCWCCSCVRCDRSARHLAQRMGSFLSFLTLTKCWSM